MLSKRVAVVFVIAATGAVATSKPVPHGHAAASLCTSGEEVLFACPIKTKIASICGQAGHAVYRFGKASHIDLEGHGLSLAQRGFSGGGETQISFLSNGYRYIAYDSTVRTAFGADERHDAEFTAGVIVQKDGKTVSNAKCGGSAEVSIRSSASKYMPPGQFIPH